MLFGFNMAATDAKNYWTGCPRTVVSFREMKITKYAKPVGTMIGLKVFYIVGLPRKKFIQRAWKMNETAKSLVERLVVFKLYALSALGYIGSMSFPDEATLKDESNCAAVYCCWTLTTLFLLTPYGWDPCAVSVVTYMGFISFV